MDVNDLIHLNYSALERGRLTPTQVDEVRYMDIMQRTLVQHRSGDQAAVEAATSIALAAQRGELTEDTPAVVLAPDEAEAGAMCTALSTLMPGLPVTTGMGTVPASHVVVLTLEEVRHGGRQLRMRPYTAAFLVGLEALGSTGALHRPVSWLTQGVGRVHAWTADDYRRCPGLAFRLFSPLHLQEYPGERTIMSEYTQSHGWGSNRQSGGWGFRLAAFDAMVDPHFWRRPDTSGDRQDTTGAQTPV